MTAKEELEPDYLVWLSRRPCKELCSRTQLRLNPRRWLVLLGASSSPLLARLQERQPFSAWAARTSDIHELLPSPCAWANNTYAAACAIASPCELAVYNGG
jgi:hypothetical protein